MQTEKILQNVFDEKLQLQNIKVDRAHRVDNKEKSKKEQWLLSWQVSSAYKKLFPKSGN